MRCWRDAKAGPRRGRRGNEGHEGEWVEDGDVRPHPRTRKTVKWGGVVVTVLLLVLWIGSAQWGWILSTRGGYNYSVSSGQCGFTHQAIASDAYLPSWNYGRLPLSFRLGFTCTRQGANWYVFVPLWAPALASLLCAATAWRLDELAHRRARSGLCKKCGYDRAGLVLEAVCPECGAAP